ncbi:TBC1 domain family member 30-like [Brachionus plicatilis]|uniref:TBC1 domain family member 30-like n=1 Tax=Brachionus plicatilis TaxID=10195 RepID=A0A3M7T8L9_BRAPC|nr:TBC1 domain family member 30-like [Brachionus plicatilis]
MNTSGSCLSEFGSKSLMNSSVLSVSQSPKLSLDESEIAESSPLPWDDLGNIDQDELLEEIERTLSETRTRSSSECLPRTPKIKPQQKSLSTKTSVDSSIRNESLVEGLLGDIYDRFNVTLKDNMDSDMFTEMSFSSYRYSGIDSNADHESEWRKSFKMPRSTLQNLELNELKSLRDELDGKINQVSAKLIRQLKQKDKLSSKLNKNFDLITALLQANSL